MNQECTGTVSLCIKENSQSLYVSTIHRKTVSLSRMHRNSQSMYQEYIGKQSVYVSRTHRKTVSLCIKSSLYVSTIHRNSQFMYQENSQSMYQEYSQSMYQECTGKRSVYVLRTVSLRIKNTYIGTVSECIKENCQSI